MNGLLGGQTQGQQQANLLGGVFQNPSNTRRQERNSLLGNALQVSQAPDPFAASAAMAGTDLGLGIGRALGFETQGDQTARVLQQVQQETLDRGLDPTTDPEGTFNFISERFRELGNPQLALQAQQQKIDYIRQLREIAPERPEIKNVRTVETDEGIRVVGTLGNQAVDVTSGQVLTEPLTPAEREDSQTQREKTVDYYIAQGLEPRLANDLANGMIVQQSDPLTGETEIVNLTGGPVPNSIPEGVSVPVRDAETGQVTDPQEEQSGQETPEVRERQGLIEDPLEVGLGPWLKEGVARTVGQFVDSANYPEVTQARTRLRSGRQFLISAWSTSGRPPLIEQERIESNIPNLGALESPARARTQLETLTTDLLEQRQADLRDIEDASIAPQVRREIQQRVNATDRMLRLIDPRALETGEPTTLSDFSPREAQSALEQNIQSGTIPENATFGAYDQELEGYPIIVDGVPLTNEQGQLLVIRK